MLNGNWSDCHLRSLLQNSEETFLREDFLRENESMKKAQTSKTSLFGGEVVQLTAEETNELNIPWVFGRVSDDYYATGHYVLLNEDEIIEEQNVDKKSFSPEVLQGKNNYIFCFKL